MHLRRALRLVVLPASAAALCAGAGELGLGPDPFRAHAERRLSLSLDEGGAPPAFGLGVAELPLGTADDGRSKVDQGALLADLLAPTRVSLEDLVPPGSSLAEETRRAWWTSDMGRLEYEWLVSQGSLGTGGLVGASRSVLRPVITFKVFGIRISLGIPIPLPSP